MDQLICIWYGKIAECSFKCQLVQTHMNWHVEIIRLEGIGHVSKSLEVVAPAGLLKPEGDSRFATFLQQRWDEVKKS